MATSLPFYGNYMGPFQGNPQETIYGPGQTGPNQYGYGRAPGQTGLGYYEQQTPAGSFAASDWGGPVQQQWGQAYTASNPFLGQTSQGVGQQQSVMPWAQQAQQVGQAANPYLGQSTQQVQQTGPNQYGGGNPYLGQAIDAASADARRNFDLSIRPALDSADRASGSFGNTALGEMRQNAYSDFGRNLGNIASGMRMQDYTQQQNLAETALGRQQAVNMANAGYNGQDLSRNMSGFLQGQGLHLQGLGQALGAAQFDANLGNSVGQFNANLRASDLGRNAQLSQALGQFNAGQLGNMSQFNAGQGNALGQFSAGQRQANNQYNVGAANSMLNQQRQLGLLADQFGQNMDFNTWQANNGLQRQGVQDQISLLNTLMGINNQGLNLGTQQQNTPLNYWQQFLGGGTQLGGQGTSNTQNLQGNPILGALGGWLAAQRMYGG